MPGKHSKIENAFISRHQSMVGQALNGSSSTLKETRDRAISNFARLGLPARKSEAWKYTNLNAVLSEDLASTLSFEVETTSKEIVDDALIPELGSPYIVINNGAWDIEASSLGNLPDGVLVTSLQVAAEKHAEVFAPHFDSYVIKTEGLAALNTAFTSSGVFIYVPNGIHVADVLQIVSVSSSSEIAFIQPRMLIVVDDNASLKIVERVISASDSPTVSNRVVETFTGCRSRLSLIRIQDENNASTNVTSLYSVQRKDSDVFDLTLTLSGKLVRNNLNFRHLDPHCETHLNGFFVGRGSNHVDNHTLVDHAMPDCYSKETFKGVLYDDSTGVFNGKVLVRKDAQRTNAYQSNKSIIVSDTAHMYSKPELEIYADDVKCSHGATTGRLEPKSLFYMQSRGISEERARALLLGAFAREVVESVENPKVRKFLSDELNHRVL